MLIYLAIPVTTFRVKALLYATPELIAHVHLMQESEQRPGMLAPVLLATLWCSLD